MYNQPKEVGNSANRAQESGGEGSGEREKDRKETLRQNVAKSASALTRAGVPSSDLFGGGSA